MTRLRTFALLLLLASLGPLVLLAGLVVGGQVSEPAVPHAPSAAMTLPADPQTTRVPVDPATLERASRSVRTVAPAQPRVLVGHAVPVVRARHLAARATGTGYDTATAVADCESGERLANGRALHHSYQLRAHDPNSTASGKYSFLDSTWEWVTGLPAPAANYSEATQDAAFRKLWDHGNGASHWNPSRTCWAGVVNG